MCRLNMSLAEHLAIEETKEAELPTCDHCKEKIRGDCWYEVEPWEMWCEECAEEWLKEHRHWIE